MPTQPSSGTSAELRARLDEAAQLLRRAHHLSPESREMLADLAEELGSALGTASISSDEMGHLAGGTAHLVQALHQQEDKSLFASARGRLEQAIIGAELQAPTVTGLVRRLLDAMTNIGI